MNKQSSDPRYEFRLLGKEFGPLAEHIERSYQPVQQGTETDTYILAAANPDYSVKLRNGKLDTKVLRRREQGMERWHPHLQIDFPLTRALLREFVFSWLSVDLPPLLRSSYTIEQFLHEAVGATPALQVAKVHKQRRHYLLYGCQVEISDLRINDRVDLRTIAVEATTAQLVTRTVETLDLQDYKNTNYVIGLLQLLAEGRPLRKQPATLAPTQQPVGPVRQPILVG